MRISSVALLLMLSGCALTAQSQPPQGNRPDTDGRSANQSPSQPPIHITVAVPKPSPEETAREEQYRQREIVAQEDVRDFTRWLTYLTVVQAFVGLAGFWVAMRAANAANRSADIAEKSLVVTQRANFGVADWKVDGLNQRQSPTELRFLVVNEGHVTGKLVEKYCAKLVVPAASTLPDTPPYRVDGAMKVSIPILPRQHLKQTFVVSPPLNNNQITGVLDGTLDLWAFGYVKYLDGFDNLRTVGFCTRYQDGEMRVGGPDRYNYSD